MDAGEDSWLRVRQWTGGQVGDRPWRPEMLRLGAVFGWGFSPYRDLKGRERGVSDQSGGGKQG